MKFIGFMVLVMMTSNILFSTPQKPIIVAHRGASGYLPEHSLPCKAMAYAMKPDYLEQDVVLSKDGYPVILHDRFLDRVTDVSFCYPLKQRNDGHFYAIDFTLKELRTLKFTEGFKDEKLTPNYPERFPVFHSSFSLHTLEEEIQLIQGLNHSTGNSVGLYVEIKSPWFHKKEGQDITRVVLKTLKKYGYSKKTDPVYLQCFDYNELKRIKNELLPEMEMDLKLVLLITLDDDESYTLENGRWKEYSMKWILTPEGIKEIANYVDGIGPHYEMIITNASQKGKLQRTQLIPLAHQYQLEVHPYTFRKDQGKVPLWADSFEEYVKVFFKEGVDGIFTDFPDLGVKIRDQFVVELKGVK